MNLEGFENPWEHIRLLSDEARNEALVALLERRAPGARVLEIGCGTGVLSVLAARLGAKQVYAVEPTGLVNTARALVAANGLQDVVEIIEGRVQALEPRPVDLVFSELLNADPFMEQVLETMAAARGWLAPGGLMSPSRLRVYVALVRAPYNSREVRRAVAQLDGLGARFDLDFSGVRDVLKDPGIYRYFLGDVELVSEPRLVWDLEVGRDAVPTAPVELTLPVLEPGPVGGAVVWFEAQLDDCLVMGNPPGRSGHWGQLVCGWGREVGLGVGASLRVRVAQRARGLMVHPLT